MSRENVEVMRKCIDAWNRGDLEAWVETGHPDIEWSSEIARRLEGTERVYRGVPELLQFWEEWRSLWDVTIDIAEIRDLGETVVAIGRLSARGHASEVDLEGPIAYVGEFDGGLLRRMRAYLDPSDALDAVGLRE